MITLSIFSPKRNKPYRAIFVFLASIFFLATVYNCTNLDSSKSNMNSYAPYDKSDKYDIAKVINAIQEFPDKPFCKKCRCEISCLNLDLNDPYTIKCNSRHCNNEPTVYDESHVFIYSIASAKLKFSYLFSKTKRLKFIKDLEIKALEVEKDLKVHEPLNILDEVKTIEIEIEKELEVIKRLKQHLSLSEILARLANESDNSLFTANLVIAKSLLLTSEPINRQFTEKILQQHRWYYAKPAIIIAMLLQYTENLELTKKIIQITEATMSHRSMMGETKLNLLNLIYTNRII